MIPPLPPPAPNHGATPSLPSLKHWAEILLECGYPADCVLIDFESFFEPGYGLKSHSIPEYIADSRWEAIALARMHVNARAPHIDPELNIHVEIGEECIASYLRYLQTTYGKELEGCTLIGQNLGFDANVLGMRYGIFPRHTVDTICLSRAYHTRSKHGLGQFCRTWKLPEKGETRVFTGCTLREDRWRQAKGRPPERVKPMDENQVEALIEYTSNDLARTFDMLQILLPRLSNPATELRIQHLTLEMFTRPTLQCDHALGESLIKSMEEKITASLPEGLTTTDVGGVKVFDRLLSDALQAVGDSPIMYMKEMKVCPANPSGLKFELAKGDPGLKRLLAHPDPRVRQLVQARVAVKSWPLHISRVKNILAMAQDGWMPVPLKYWGGHTGRDSGNQNINLQNLAKRGDPLLIAMRGLLAAPLDKELVIVDASAIEGRITPWFADQDDLVQKFRDGAEVYCDLAAKIVGYPCRKARHTDPPAIAKAYMENRNLGKVGVLGCGYGMGAAKVVDYAVGYGLSLTPTMAQKLVDTYRQMNHKIVAYWRMIEKAFLYTARYHKPCSITHGVSFHSTDEIDVVMVLPNGRHMNYHEVKIGPGNFGQDSASVYNELEHKTEHIWGGTLCLAGGTPVLTDRGWVPLALVKTSDKVWDGHTWVVHEGVVYNGQSPTVSVDGVMMTPDHEVWSDNGWVQAQFCRSDGEAVWFTNGGIPPLKWQAPAVGVPVRLREYRDTDGPRATKAPPRVYVVSLQSLPSQSFIHHPSHSWYVPSSRFCRVAKHVRQVQVALTSGMAQLRRAGNQGVRAMAGKFREFLVRHGINLPPTNWDASADAGSHRQQWQLRTRQLQVGDVYGTGEQQAVYDLLNAGPRHCFTVMGKSNEPFLVHNCENLVQATARDVLMEAMLRLEDMGYHTAHRVHDELIIVVDKGQGERVLKIAEAEMSRTPVWAPGLPLGAEGKVAERYGLH